MSDAKHTISSCRHCVFYEMQGRRGGHCQQLGVSVQGRWKVCSLASPPFASSWQQLERLVALPTFEAQITATPLSEHLPELPEDVLLSSQVSFQSERGAADSMARSVRYELASEELA